MAPVTNGASHVQLPLSSQSGFGSAPTQMAAQSAEQWKAKGNEHFGAGKYSQAVDCYTKAIQAHASSPTEGNIAIYYSNRSAAYFNLKKLNEALEDATNAIKLDKNYFKAYVRQSTVLSSQGRTRDALRAILAAKLVPGSEADPSVQEAINSCWTNHIGTPISLIKDQKLADPLS